MKIAYLNGKYLPLEKANISILDRGFLYGDGLFETVRAYGGTAFLLEKHLERLFKSLKIFRIRPKAAKSEIKRVVYSLLRRNGLSASNKKDAYIKIIITRGKSLGLLAPATKANPAVAIYVLPYTPPGNYTCRKGVKLLISKERSDEKSIVAGNKTLNYLSNVMWRYEAKLGGFDDCIFVNTNGFLCEASSSNIFLVIGKEIKTPSLLSGCLAGITRGEVIKLAKKYLSYRIKEDLIKPDALYSANEIFITNSLAGILPVAKVNGKTIGSGEAGPVTNELIRLFDIAVKKYRENNRHEGYLTR